MTEPEPITLAVEGAENSALLSAFVRTQKIADLDRSSDQAELLLIAEEKGIRLRWRPNSQQLLEYVIDVEAFVAQQKTFPAARQKGLNQAIGKKTKRVIDATAGWAGDALLLTSQGFELVLIERNPIMALLLTDAMQRLGKTAWAAQHNITVPRVVEGDAIKLLSARTMQADCVYLDPMFPAKRKKSAAVNKYMQLLQRLVGPDQDAQQLVTSAISAGYKRVVVKRPDYADSLQGKPSVQFSSKLVHYDVYL